MRVLRAIGWSDSGPRERLLLIVAAASMASFAAWNTLLNNFAVDRAAFDGADIGLLQTVREIPGFLTVTVLAFLLIIREQRLALISLGLLGAGVAATGMFPSLSGLLMTTFVMSVGFHYFEALHQSLALQWLEKDRAPLVLGRIVAATSVAGLAGTGAVWLAAGPLGLDYVWMYLGAGAVAVATALRAMAAYPQYKPKVEQNRKIVLRQRYWLFYSLTFLSGARRQIFVVFAAFLLVEKFGYSVAEVAALFFLNGALNGLLAPVIGRLIGRWGERRALIIEYAGLVLVFTGYAFVESAWMAGALYVIDHLFFALAIAIKTYFQKIADPADLASSAGVSFTINHIAAVAIPVSFGLLWLVSPAAVFLSGAAMAAASLGISFLVPHHPRPGRETTLRHAPVPAPAE